VTKRDRSNEAEADRFDRQLKGLADTAYARREIDPRWEQIRMFLDAARIPAREMMSEKDRQEKPE